MSPVPMQSKPADWVRRPSAASSSGSTYMDALSPSAAATSASSRRPSAATARSGSSSLFSTSSTTSLQSTTRKPRSRNASAVYGASPPTSPSAKSSSRRNILQGSLKASAEHQSQSNKWKALPPSSPSSQDYQDDLTLTPSTGLVAPSTGHLYPEEGTSSQHSHQLAQSPASPSTATMKIPSSSSKRGNASSNTATSTGGLLRPGGMFSKRVASADSSFSSLSAPGNIGYSSELDKQQEQAEEWAKVLAQQQQQQHQQQQRGDMAQPSQSSSSSTPMGIPQSKSATLRSKIFGNRKREKSAPTSLKSFRKGAKSEQEQQHHQPSPPPMPSPKLPADVAEQQQQQQQHSRPSQPSKENRVPSFTTTSATPVLPSSSDTTFFTADATPADSIQTQRLATHKEGEQSNSTELAPESVSRIPRSGSSSSLIRAGSWPPSSQNRSSFVSSDKGNRAGADGEAMDKPAEKVGQNRIGGYRFENAAAAYGGSNVTGASKRWGMQNMPKPPGTSSSDFESRQSKTSEERSQRFVPPPIDTSHAKNAGVTGGNRLSASFLALSSPAQSFAGSLAGSQGIDGSVASSADSPLFSQGQLAPQPPSHTPNKPERLPPKPPGYAGRSVSTDGASAAASHSMPPPTSYTPPSKHSNLHGRHRHGRRPASSTASFSLQSGDFSSENSPFHVHLPRSSSLRSSQMAKLNVEEGFTSSRGVGTQQTTTPVRSSASSHGYLDVSDADLAGHADSALGLSSPVTEADGMTYNQSLNNAQASEPKTSNSFESHPSSNSVSRLPAMFGGQLSKSHDSPSKRSKDHIAGRHRTTDGSDPPPADNAHLEHAISRRGSQQSVYEDAQPELNPPLDDRTKKVSIGASEAAEGLAVPSASGSKAASLNGHGANQERPVLPAKSPLRPNREWTMQVNRPATASLASHGAPSAIRESGYKGTSASAIGHGQASQGSSSADAAVRAPPVRKSLDDLDLGRVTSPLRPSIERAAVINGSVPLSTSAGSFGTQDSMFRARRMSNGLAQGLLEPLQISTNPMRTDEPLTEEAESVSSATGDASARSPMASPASSSRVALNSSSDRKASKSARKPTSPANGIANALKTRKFSIGARDADGSMRSKRWPFGKDVLSDAEEDVPTGAGRGAKRSIRKKAGEPMPRLEIKRVFDSPVEGKPFHAADASPSQELMFDGARRRMPSGRSVVPLNKKVSTASFASAGSGESHFSSAMSDARMHTARSPGSTIGIYTTDQSTSVAPAAHVQWSKDDLDEEGKLIYKRRNIIRELVHTEQSYASDLAIVRDVYLHGAKQKAGIPSNLALWSTVTGISPSITPGAFNQATASSPAVAGASPLSSSQSPRDALFGRSVSLSERRGAEVLDTSRDPAIQSPKIGLPPTSWSGLTSATASPALSNQPSIGGDRNSAGTFSFSGTGANSTLPESNRSSVWTSNSTGGASSTQPTSKSGSKSDLDASSAKNFDFADMAKRNPGTPPVSNAVASSASHGLVADLNASSPVVGAASRSVSSRSNGDISTPPQTIGHGHVPRQNTRPALAQEMRVASTGSVQSANGREDVPFTLSEMRVVFAGVEACATFATELSVILQASMGSLSAHDLPEDPRDLKDLEDDGLGQALCEVSDRIRSVYSSYCSKHEASISRLQQLSKTSRTADFLKECTDVARRYTNAWDLSSLLIKPVQRMLKYPLLLQQIISATSPTHPDYTSLVAAAEEMQAIADFINELNRRRDIITQIVKGGKASTSGSSSSGKISGSKTLRRKAGTKSREKIAPSTFNATMGGNLAILEGDDAYNELLGTFAALEHEIPVLAAKCIEWAGSARFQHSRHMDLLRQWQKVYSMSGSTAPSEHPDEQIGNDDGAAGLQRFVDRMHRVGDAICFRTESQIRHGIVPALEKILPIFEGPRAYIQKRDERQDDYDKCRTTAGRVTDRKLIDSANGFVALHSQLLDELPTFICGVKSAVDVVLVSFARIQSQHSVQMREAVETFLNGSDAGDGQANTSGTSSSATVVTTQSVREVIQNWWGAHRGVAAAMDGLAICNREGGPSAAQYGHNVRSKSANGDISSSGQDLMSTERQDASATSSQLAPIRRTSQSSGSSSLRQGSDHFMGDAEALRHPLRQVGHSMLSPSAAGPMRLPHVASDLSGAMSKSEAPRNVSSGSSVGGRSYSAMRSLSGGLSPRGSGASSHNELGTPDGNGLTMSRRGSRDSNQQYYATHPPDVYRPAFRGDSNGGTPTRGLATAPTLPTLDLGEADLSPQVSITNLPQAQEQSKEEDVPVSGSTSI
ncbi:unnamed protein product [Sympodiomycopsis kandeliae]